MLCLNNILLENINANCEVPKEQSLRQMPALPTLSGGSIHRFGILP